MKRVFVFSKKEEPTTDRVIMWLINYGANVIRINNEDGLESFFNVLSGELTINENRVNNFDSFWVYHYPLNNTYTASEIEEREHIIFRDYFISNIADKSRCIGSSLQDIYQNKLIDLKIAKKCGLKIPFTCLATSVEDLKKRNYFRNKKFIIKPLSNYFRINNNSKVEILDLFEVNKIENLPQYFFLHYFRKRLLKNLRYVFLLLKKCFFLLLFFHNLKRKPHYLSKI